MQLFIWIINDTVCERGVAIGFAADVQAAITAICDDVKDEDEREELRTELQSRIPDEMASGTYGRFLVFS